MESEDFHCFFCQSRFAVFISGVHAADNGKAQKPLGERKGGSLGLQHGQNKQGECPFNNCCFRQCKNKSYSLQQVFAISKNFDIQKCIPNFNLVHLSNFKKKDLLETESMIVEVQAQRASAVSMQYSVVNLPAEKATIELAS